MYQELTDNMHFLFPEPPLLQSEFLCLRPLTLSHAGDLQRLTRQEAVYRYLPTFLFEKKYPTAEEVILHIYRKRGGFRLPFLL